MSTIRDLAKRAGVSVSTASLALNGDSRVRPQTRQRVERAALELNYHPMRAARSLSSGRTWSLQLLNPVGDGSLSSGFFTRFARGVHDVARERHYSVALSILDDEGEAAAVLERLIFERWADGVILMNPTQDEGLLSRLLETGFPHVLLGRASQADVLSVDNDNIQVAFDATSHLLDRGRGPVLLLNGPAHHTFTVDRAEGFRRAHERRGLAVDGRLLQFGQGTAEAAADLVGALLADGLRFGGILAVSDALALGAMRALRLHGLLVPDDVAVVGMNNDDLTEYTQPRLTSVELNAHLLGREAASLLLATIAGERPEPSRHLVPHHLALRESS